MFDSISITGFRGFSNFQLSNLGRINLIVGKNNTGKTSILEAIDILASGGAPDVIVSGLSRRGELAYPDSRGLNHDEFFVDVSRIFHGYNQSSDRSLGIRNCDSFVKMSIVAPAVKGISSSTSPATKDGDSIYLSVEVSEPINNWRTDLIEGVGLSYQLLPFRLKVPIFEKPIPSLFISTDSISIERTSELWAPIALTKMEQLVVEALHGVDERIEKLALIYPQGPRAGMPGRGGFRVKLKDVDAPVSIGSLGEGVWRIFALTIAAVSAKGGVLLVDDIDTGLHFTVLDGLWKTLLNLSKLLDIQIFATTHSRDCVERLAAICHPGVDVGSDVTIQRIDPDSEAAVAYSEQEVLVAAERGFEVR